MTPVLRVLALAALIVLAESARAACNADAQAVLAAAERSHPAGAVTAQSGWNRIEDDLVGTNATLLADVAREYAAAGCWDDALRLAAMPRIADQAAGRVAEQYARAGRIDDAVALARRIASPYVRRDAFERIVEQLIAVKQFARAFELAPGTEDPGDEIRSRYHFLLYTLLHARESEEVVAVAAKLRASLKSFDLLQVAIAHARLQQYAQARSLLDAAQRAAPGPQRKWVRSNVVHVLASFDAAAAQAMVDDLRNPAERSATMVEAIGALREEPVLRRWLAELGRLEREKGAVGGCDAAFWFARFGDYELARDLIQLRGCLPGSDPEIVAAERMNIVVEAMVKAGKIDLALQWAAAATARQRPFVRDALVYGLVKAGRPDEALQELKATGPARRPHLFIAVAGAADERLPFLAWLDAVPVEGGAELRQCALQAMLAAYARVHGPKLALNWATQRLQAVELTRALLGIAQGSRGQQPGMGGYWSTGYAVRLY